MTFLCSHVGWAETSRALFSAEELREIERYKSDQYVISQQIKDWRQRESGFFKELIRNTSQEDLSRLKKDLPHVLVRMEEVEQAKWLELKLNELSERK